MAEIRIPLDIYNMAQYYACLGVLKLLTLLHLDDELLSRFDIEGHMGYPNSTFIITSEAEVSMAEVQCALTSAWVSVRKDAPVVKKSKKHRGEPDTSLFPVELALAGKRLLLDWWLDEYWLEKSQLKLFAGRVGAPQLVERFCDEAKKYPAATPILDYQCPTKESAVWGFDRRSLRDALKKGYSSTTVGEPADVYPTTELLCAIGLQDYRPERVNLRETGELGFKYYTWGEDLPSAVTVMASRCPLVGLSECGYFAMIAKKGQGNYEIGEVVNL
jgi:CRISPR-associated protein Csb3